MGKDPKQGPGRPIQYPDSPLHLYWRELKRRERARKKAEESLDSIPRDEAVLAVDTQKVEAGA